MDILDIAFRIGISFIIGGFVGLEREIHENVTSERPKSGVLGLRTFSLTAGLGGLLGLVLPFQPIVFALGASALTLILISNYIVDALQTKSTGITSELSLLFTFISGVFIGSNLVPTQIVIAVIIVVALLLAHKEEIKSVIGDMQQRELNAFVAFAAIALVILPFLPNTSYSLSDIPNIAEFVTGLGLTLGSLANVGLLNPFKLWLYVALITGIDLIGYFMEKFIGGRKGWFVTSFVGGFISSTATTQSLALESKQSRFTNALLASALLANLASFFQMFFILGAANLPLLLRLFPILIAMILSGLGLVLFFSLRKQKRATRTQTQSSQKQASLLNIEPALKFVGIFLIVNIVSKVALELFGRNAFILSSSLAAMTGVDAALLNLSELAGKNIDLNLAALVFVLVNAVNLVSKAVYCFVQGEKGFAWRFLLSIITIIAASLVGFLFVR